MNDNDRATDYTMSKSDANELLGAVLLPNEIRALVLTKYLEKNGAKSLVNLFSQFIGMANSVIQNNRESLELFMIVDRDYHPYQAEKINLPTLFGALNGVKLADGVDQNKTCHGCACRLGSLANQSPSTTTDVDWCMGNDDIFMCHEDMDESGRPTRRCVGFARLKKELAS